jgi:hypothetical protein
MGEEVYAMIVRFILLCMVLLVATGSYVIIANGGDSFDVTIEDTNTSFSFRLQEQNFTETESDAVLVAVETLDKDVLIVNEVNQHEDTRDYYVSLQDGDDSVVIIVRNESNYAYSINGGPIERCYTHQDSKYCK